MKLLVGCALVALAVGSSAEAGQDCGKNLSCLATAARTCTPAKAVHDMTMNLFDIQTKASYRYEITGRQGKDCQLEKTQLSGQATLGPKAKAGAKSKGKDPAQMEKEINRQMKEQIGKTVRCKAPPAELAKQIESWKAGRFSTDDLCQPGR